MFARRLACSEYPHVEEVAVPLKSLASSESDFVAPVRA